MSNTHRTETDFLGELSLSKEFFYGIHTARALENFPLSGLMVHPSLIHAYGVVKQAATSTIHHLGGFSDTPERYAAIERAASELSTGQHDAHVVVDALQGGAGTSLNMNVNEVIANRALQLLGEALGRYDLISPLDDINRYQSTNDTYPTALRMATIRGLQKLETRLTLLQTEFRTLETRFATVVKVGRTQYQDAVLTTLGREMGAYAEALGRDRLRVFKSIESLRVVNLGGTAIGTGQAAPRDYILQVVKQLRELSGLDLVHADNLVDATQNCDVYVEVSGHLKAAAINLIKICSDLRLLSSGPDAGFGEIRLPPRQAGSSIMPGKINPVIPEAATQAALRVCGHDQAITTAAGMGSLELNSFLPLIADSLLNSIDLLGNAYEMLASKCVCGIEADIKRCRKTVGTSTALVTALLPALGYEAAARVAKEAANSGQPLRDVVLAQGLLDANAFDALISPEAIDPLGNSEPPK